MKKLEGLLRNRFSKQNCKNKPHKKTDHQYSYWNEQKLVMEIFPVTVRIIYSTIGTHVCKVSFSIADLPGSVVVVGLSGQVQLLQAGSVAEFIGDRAILARCFTVCDQQL